MTSLALEAVALAAGEPTRVVLIQDGREYRVGEIVAAANSLAAGLQQLGLMPGDVVSLILPNWAEAMTINLAAGMAGLVVNPIVPIYRDAELRHILNDCASRAVFVPERVRSIEYGAILGRLAPHLPSLRHVVKVRGGEGLTMEAVAAQAGAPLRTHSAAPRDLKMVMYTSGTTGPAKGVLHTHASLRRVIETGAANWGLPPGPTMLVATPVGHVTGFLWGLEAPFIVGTRVVLQDRWDAAEAVRLIDHHAVDLTTGAAPFLSDTVAAARAAGSAVPSLRLFGCGGAAVTPDLIRSARATFAQAVAYRVYGSTELPNITQGYTDQSYGDLSAETDGRPTDYDVRIVGPTGAPVPDGAVGEITARGPAMFRGYTNPALTREAFGADGYFRTGDLGRRTAEGAIVITGRQKDLIIRGGENLSPKEIEDVLAGHPLVREAAAVGMPEARLGEAVCVFVIASDAGAPTLQHLTEFMEAKGLARQKFPQRLELVDELPRTASGKVRKDLLRQRVRDLVAASV